MKYTHTEARELMKAYKNAAKELLANSDQLELMINSTGTVQFMDDGAFVDCIIWVPFSKIHLPDENL